MFDPEYWLKEKKDVFNAYSQYLKHKYNEPVYRISVDGGFSCPNRGTGRLAPGCVYCDETGSKAPYLGVQSNIEEQITGAAAFLKKRYKVNSFILYFQAFSGTHAPVDVLKKIYDHALALMPFKELIISTRPDCIDQDKADLISSYKKSGIEVWVELGLQSSHDKTLQLVNRGHNFQQFLTAYKLLIERGIKTTVHIIFGLPGEGAGEIGKTIETLAALEPDGVKIHNLHIPGNTVLHMEYLKGEITVPSAQSHQSYVINALEKLPAKTAIMRLTCDTTADRLVFPRKFMNKALFYEKVREKMKQLDTYQGKYFKNISSNR